MSIHFDNAERADKEIIIQADKGRIIQVISNILYKAIRFAKEGNIIISIKKMMVLIPIQLAMVVVIVLMAKEKSSFV